jgi:MFS family permease
MFTPSIYQFITTPRSLSDEQSADEKFDHFWPGLGGSNRDYALAVISFGFFEAVSLLLGTFIMDTIPYTVSLLMMLSLYALGGALYATATQVWMVILGRGLMGIGTFMKSSVMYTYIGEMGTVMDESRKKKGKPPRKNLLYTMALLATSFANTLWLGIYAAIARIPSVDPYRWPGWFLVATSLSLAAIVLLFFTEPRPWTCHRKTGSKCSPAGLGLSMKLRSHTKKHNILVSILQHQTL